MKVVLSQFGGFCPGVKRAIELAESNPNSVIIGGEIVHNPIETKRLENDFGIKIQPDHTKVNKGQTVIIRAHGISPHMEMQMKDRGIKIIDATCPRVKKVQILINDLAGKGYHVILLGDISHPETQGHAGYANGNITVVKDMVEIEKQAKSFHGKLALLAQTTKQSDVLHEMSNWLNQNGIKHEFFNTTCSCVTERQQHAKDLAKSVDVAVVVGGRNSFNTKLLVDAMGDFCKVHHIESIDDINHGWFDNIKTCGVIGGVSTSDYTLKEVERFLAKSVKI